MNLKIGGNSVGKIMYGGQEFGGSQMLESGTILLVLASNTTWTKKRLGLNFVTLSPNNSITCKAFGVEKDWKNVSQIRVYVGANDAKIMDVSELKNGPCNVATYVTVKIKGNELTFTNNSQNYVYNSILVEAYNE